MMYYVQPTNTQTWLKKLLQTWIAGPGTPLWITSSSGFPIQKINIIISQTQDLTIRIVISWFITPINYSYIAHKPHWPSYVRQV